MVTAAGPNVDVPIGSRVAGLVDGFDRDFGTYAEQLIVPALNIAVVPNGLDLVTAATVPLNGLAAAQLVDLLGDGEGRTLLVTGAAGAVGGYTIPLGQDRGWRVTGLARAEDEQFVRDLGADFTVKAAPGSERGRRRCHTPGAGRRAGPRQRPVRRRATCRAPAEERGVTVRVVVAHPDGARLAQLLDQAASGHLPARVHAVVPLDEVAEAHRSVAKGGVRGRYVLQP